MSLRSGNLIKAAALFYARASLSGGSGGAR